MFKDAMGKKVLVAMSGGVDSSVAAVLLQAQGYEVVGCFMRLGSEEEEASTCDAGKAKAADAGLSLPMYAQQSASASGAHDTMGTLTPPAKKQGCCSLNDAADARLVCAMLDIPFYAMNFRDDFGRIKDYFSDEYHAGRTPNPCIRCNTWLKFGKLARYAQSIDADYVATGHYAQVQHLSDRSRLLAGIDAHKDQSYVLFGTNSEQLRHMLLPVGQYKKKQIRAIAKEHGLPVFDKPDSQEICFVPDNDYADFVKKHSDVPIVPGPIVDMRGNTLGQHRGHQHFTLGQRRGLGLSGPEPVYVIDKNAKTNTVVVGDRAALGSVGLMANETNWLIAAPTEKPLRCKVKIRSTMAAVDATVLATGQDQLQVQFDWPEDAVSPGQAVACYLEDELIGGGWIDRAF